MCVSADAHLWCSMIGHQLHRKNVTATCIARPIHIPHALSQILAGRTTHQQAFVGEGSADHLRLWRLADVDTWRDHTPCQAVACHQSTVETWRSTRLPGAAVADAGAGTDVLPVLGELRQHWRGVTEVDAGTHGHAPVGSSTLIIACQTTV